MDISNVPTEIAFILSYNIALLLPVLCSIFTEATILGQNGGDEAAVKVRSSQVFRWSLLRFYHPTQTLCSNLDRGTSGHKSCLDRVLPVMTISTPEARLLGRAGSPEGLVGRLLCRRPLPFVPGDVCGKKFVSTCTNHAVFINARRWLSYWSERAPFQGCVNSPAESVKWITLANQSMQDAID